mmetsp:Transcript_67224/g.217237  ORF Transcript_67224/g.217237 Transcript_67224/m.217237 type:complete len:711 (+) Transcript_67224:196-2328(+)
MALGFACLRPGQAFDVQVLADHAVDTRRGCIARLHHVAEARAAQQLQHHVGLGEQGTRALIAGMVVGVLRPFRRPRSRHKRLRFHKVAAKNRNSVDTRAVAMMAVGKSRTERLLELLPDAQDGSSGAGSAGSYTGLQAIDRAWERVRGGSSQASQAPPPEFVHNVPGPLPGDQQPHFDVAVCGGTLGIFVASALQRRGLRVCVLERGKLAGRVQEWNISLQELRELVEAGALDASDIDGATRTPSRGEVVRNEAPSSLVAVQFGSVRAGFNSEEFGPTGSEDPRLQEIWLDGVLNCGIRPSVAVARARARFEAAGGEVREGIGVNKVSIHSNGACLHLADEETITAKLVIDAMGNQSPISRQARGGGTQPFGVCIVVGTTASGFDLDNSMGDLIYTNSDIWSGDVPDGESLGSPRKQYYWEAFPTGAGETERTTYLFTYMDAAAERPSVEQQLEDYWDLLPSYQRHNCSAFRDEGLSAEQAVTAGKLQLKRVLYGCFPTYRDSPLPPVSDRVLAVGDASGIQSPLSFGGFGALTRHLVRVSDAVAEALAHDTLSREDLAAVNAYLPNQAATWMFQRAMMVPIGDRRPSDFVNRLLRNNFQIMSDLGPEVLKPFNQDIVQPRQLARVLLEAVRRDPLNIPLLVYHIGPELLVDWLGHMFAMFAFDMAHHVLGKIVRDIAAALTDSGQHESAFRLRRLAEQWEFGSGQDYKL